MRERRKRIEGLSLAALWVSIAILSAVTGRGWTLLSVCLVSAAVTTTVSLRRIRHS